MTEKTNPAAADIERAMIARQEASMLLLVWYQQQRMRNDVGSAYSRDDVSLAAVNELNQWWSTTIDELIYGRLGELQHEADALTASLTGKPIHGGRA